MESIKSPNDTRNRYETADFVNLTDISNLVSALPKTTLVHQVKRASEGQKNYIERLSLDNTKTPTAKKFQELDAANLEPVF